MKTISKLSLVVVFLSLFISTPLFAATPPPTTPTSNSSQAIILADVNINEAKIVKQENNKFDISFILSNGKGIQTGVKYGVQLVSTSNKIQTTVDEKIYNESLTLYENSSIKKTIQYTAPEILDGTFSLYIISKNEEGFPYSTGLLGTVRIKASQKGIYISSGSCFLKVPGEKNSVAYKLNPPLDIGIDENISISCFANNNSDKEIQVNPVLEIRESNSYGKLVELGAIDIQSISYKSKESKLFSITLPNIDKSGTYYATIALKEGNILSNKVSFSYIVRGSSATISNVLMDKDYYQKGETANVSLLWNSIVGKLVRGDATNNASISATTLIKNSIGQECSNQIVTPLVFDLTKPKTEIPISIKKNCFNPTITITLKDSVNKVLDEKSFTIQTVSVKKSTNIAPIIIVILLILAAIILYMYKKNKRSINSETNNIETKILILFIFLFGTLLFTNNAYAGSYYETMSISGTSCYIAYSANIDKPSGYMTNDTLIASATIGACGCSDGRAVFCGIQSTVAQGGSLLAPTTPQLLSQYAGGGTSGSYSYQLPSWGGSGQVNFQSFINTSFGGTSIAFSVSTPPTVSLSVWADNNVITSGSQAHIHWASTNATSCISTDGGTYDTRLSGDYYHTPTADKTYSVTCFDAGGGSIVKSTPIFVTTPAPTVTVSASQTNISYGGTVSVSWKPLNATHCECTYTGSGGGSCGQGISTTQASFPVSFTLTQNTTFNVTCYDNPI
ncbi:MAG: hypothetical protein WCW54_00160 [Candidatus Paceibacterota bacterium]